MDFADWLQRDEVFAAQMAEKERLFATRRAEVFQPGEAEVAGELLTLILRHLGPGYRVGTQRVTRPDGVAVSLAAPPLLTAARLVQEDLCLLQKPEGADEHVLTGAALCFPASWSLAEKLNRPLGRIHDPVPNYDPGMATRVQRMFDMLHPDRPLWRQNALLYANPALFQPRREANPRGPEAARYLRSERQCLVKLPKSGAVVFSIHTWVVPLDRLSAAQRAGLETYPVEQVE